MGENSQSTHASAGSFTSLMEGAATYDSPAKRVVGAAAAAPTPHVRRVLELRTETVTSSNVGLFFKAESGEEEGGRHIANFARFTVEQKLAWDMRLNTLEAGKEQLGRFGDALWRASQNGSI